jgi:hypothetical protein
MQDEGMQGVKGGRNEGGNAGSQEQKEGTEASLSSLSFALLQAINKSLSALGDVISALATESQHIPYR